MKPISTDEVLRFAERSGGVEFKTLTEGSTFRVKVEMDGISFYPKTGLGRPNSREFINRYVALFNREQSFVTTPYVKAKLRSASYFLALVKAMLESVRQVESPEQPAASVAPILPHDIESQLLGFLQRSNHGGRAERNADIIAFYYGFRGQPFPTLEETASAEGLTPERARKIIETYFRERVKPAELLGIFRAQELLRSVAPVSADDFIELMRDENLIAADCSPAGILRLIHDVTHDDSVNLFDQDLRPTNSGQTINQADELFYVPAEQVEAVRSVLRYAKTLPGQLGIANFQYLEEKLGPQSAPHQQIVRRIVETSPQFWTKRHGGDLWYLCEVRENTLVNNLFKACNVTESCPVHELAVVLHRALKSRKLDHPVAGPEVIGDYLRQSRFLAVWNGIAHFRKATCETVDLSPPQEAVRRMLAEFGPRGASFPALKAKFTTLAADFSDATLAKAILNSPIVSVSGSRGHRTYRLLTFAKEDREVGDDERRLERYRELLRDVSELGTDATSEVKRRREQVHLSDYVFGDAKEATCAICQALYPVTALVAAHKKPRYRCTHSERIDPLIVMPLCLLGCDFLYEENLVYVANGVVRVSPKATALPGLAERVAALNGKRLEERWARGTDYFRRLE